MRTRSTRTCLALAVLLVACDGGKAEKPAPVAEKTAPPVEQPAADKPAEKPADTRVLADSGLGVGGKFKAFDIVNCETGDTYCQVCRFGSSPKIMAVGTLDDPAFGEDIKNLDALVQKYGEDKLKAFAVITDIKDGKSVTPTEGRDELQARVKALREQLGVKIPLVIPAAAEGKADFDDYYNITKSRTLMFADGSNAVKYSGVAPADLSELNAAIQQVLGVADPAAKTG
ncbi:MAG TPA: hypothetical protein VIK91_05450 [Nannocystis sp.]